MPDEGRTLLARALAGTDRARSIVGSLLDYARASTGELQRGRFPLAEALAEAEAETGPQLAEAKAEVVSDGLPLVSGDRGQLVELLVQLLDNAVRYRGAEPAVITVSADVVDGGVRVTVADNGPGVAETDLPRLFTAFARPVPASETANGRGAGPGARLVPSHRGASRRHDLGRARGRWRPRGALRTAGGVSREHGCPAGPCRRRRPGLPVAGPPGPGGGQRVRGGGRGRRRRHGRCRSTAGAARPRPARLHAPRRRRLRHAAGAAGGGPRRPHRARVRPRPGRPQVGQPFGRSGRLPDQGDTGPPPRR